MKKLIRITSVPISMEKLLGNQLSFMNGYYDVTAVSSDEEYLQRLAQNLGVQHHTVEMTREITPLKDFKAIYKMYRFFRKSKPDIVHSHTPKAGLVSMIAAYLARVPVRMHTVAGLPLLESTGFKRRLLSRVEWLTYRFCTKVYPNSVALKNIILQEKFCNASKLKVLGNGSSNGIDLSHFRPTAVSTAEKKALQKELQIEEDDFVFVFLGRIVKDKGINELVSAFKSLSEMPLQYERVLPEKRRKARRAQRVPMHLSVGGDPRREEAETRRNGYDNTHSLTGLDLRQRLGRVLYGKPSSGRSHSHQIGNAYSGSTDLRSALAEHRWPVRAKYPKIKLLLVGPLEQEHNPILNITLSEIKRNVQIISTGYVQDVRPYLALSDCLLLPSYREGFPNVVLQAGAMGVPSIVSDINGCNEIVEHDHNGLIIPVKNEKALLAAMKTVLNDEKILAKLRTHSREKIVKKYCQKKIWQALLAEYREAAGS